MEKLIAALLVASLCLCGCQSANKAAPQPDRDEFLDFFNRTLYPTWITMAYDSPEEIAVAPDHWGPVGLLARIRKYCNERAAIISEINLPFGNRLYPASDITAVSMDHSGYDFPLFSDDEKSQAASSYELKLFEPLFMLSPYEGLFWAPDDDSYHFSDGIISIESGLEFNGETPKTSYYRRMKYQISLHAGKPIHTLSVHLIGSNKRYPLVRHNPFKQN